MSLPAQRNFLSGSASSCTSARLVWIARDTSGGAPISEKRKHRRFQGIEQRKARRGYRAKVKVSPGILPLQWWMAEPGHYWGKGEQKGLEWDEQLGMKTREGLDFPKLLGRCNLGVIISAWEKGHHFPDLPLIPHTWTCFLLLSRALAVAHVLPWAIFCSVSPSSWPSPQGCWTLPDCAWGVCAFPSSSTVETSLCQSLFCLVYPPPSTQNVPLLVQCFWQASVCPSISLFPALADLF